jgi:hypothetical protein
MGKKTDSLAKLVWFMETRGYWRVGAGCPVRTTVGMMVTENSAGGPGLADGWRNVLLVTWVGAFAGMIAVAVSSRTIGRPVWWLGSGSDPAPVLFLAVPVALVFLPLAAAMRLPRRAVSVSLACSLALLATGIPDAGDRLAVAVATWTVAGAALLATVAVMVGARQYR